MDIEVLINSIYGSENELIQEELIEDLIKTLNQSELLVLNNLKRIFLLIENLLHSEKDNYIKSMLLLL